MKRHHYEDDICKAFVQHLDFLIKIHPAYKDLFYYHIPNGGYRNIIEAKKFKSIGVKAGVSDYFIMRANSRHHGLYLEVKVIGNKLTKAQKIFFEIAENADYKTVVVTSATEAIKTIEEYLNE